MAPEPVSYYWKCVSRNPILFKVGMVECNVSLLVSLPSDLGLGSTYRLHDL